MYKYKVFNSSLISFDTNSQYEIFFARLYAQLEKIGVPMIKLTNLWKVDEYDRIFEINSDLGNFKIILDMYGEVFIQIKNNDKLFKQIYFLLKKSKDFKENEDLESK